MGNRRSEHDEAVSRRLAMLTAELAAVRGESAPPSSDRELGAPATPDALGTLDPLSDPLSDPLNDPLGSLDDHDGHTQVPGGPGGPVAAVSEEDPAARWEQWLQLSAPGADSVGADSVGADSVGADAPERFAPPSHQPTSFGPRLSTPVSAPATVTPDPVIIPVPGRHAHRGPEHVPTRLRALRGSAATEPSTGPATGPSTGPDTLAPGAVAPAGQGSGRRGSTGLDSGGRSSGGRGAGARGAGGRGPAARLPRPQVGRGILLAPAHLIVIALIAAVGLGLIGWSLLRPDGTPVAGTPAAQVTTSPGVAPDAVPSAPASAPQPLAGSATPGASPAPGVAAPASSGRVVVSVVGKVRRPGLVVLPLGARVADALREAGGARDGVSLIDLNQARVLVDGEQIAVGVPGASGVAPGAVGSGVPSNGAEPVPALVNLNTATQTELEELPGVGPVTAQSIIDYRSTNGGFASVDQLLEVDGIGEKTLADLAPHVTI